MEEKQKKLMKTMDGNEAAAYVSYAFTEVATIYPITPSSPMAEHVDAWSAAGKKNLFGQRVKLVEMQSEAGACGAMHGALESGALATSYTASQGLLLMIPPMYRISGQLHPGVLHVSARSVGTHAFSIFGEHSDVMATRQTGFAMLCSSTVQEIMDLAHLAAIKGRVPFLHFFDGFRTSHEIQKVEVMDYADLDRLLDRDALDAFRKRSLNPERPVQRSTVQNPDVYFQYREAANPYYEAIPEIVENYMGEINKITGRDYHLFNYYGCPDAEEVIIAMGSVDGVIRETVDYLNAHGRKTGYLQVHLYRPFSIKHFLSAIPETVKRIAVMDRTKEPGAAGEPLYEDVCSVILESGRNIKVLACRYGLASKDYTPDQVIAQFDNMKAAEPKNHYTIGINDDVTHHSLAVGAPIDVVAEGTISCKFWGLGSDGTVGANKNTIKIIGDHTDLNVQAYFEYDGKKSGGVTRSHLRFGKKPINSTYLVNHADFIACHNKSYLDRYDILADAKEGANVLITCDWKGEELEKHLTPAFKKAAALKKIHLYTIDSTAIAAELGLGSRTNTILQAAFFKITGIIPIEEAVGYMKKAILKSYGRKGEKIVNMNYAAVDKGVEMVEEAEVPARWADIQIPEEKIDENLPKWIRKIQMPVNAMKGDNIPVSDFTDLPDGTMPQGTSKYEKRGIAVNIPVWDSEKCIQCNMCSYVCPHSCIRPFLVNEDEAAKAPETFTTTAVKGKGAEGLRFRLQVSALDCTGCGSCANVCPSKEKAITMKPLDNNLNEADNWEYAMKLAPKANPFGTTTVKGSQFEQPLLEFPGSCPGCGETPYAKLITQLFGDRMYVATATGCSQVWSTSFPSFPYTTNHKGQGPAVGGSLFENNAEFSLGMCLAVTQQRERVAGVVKELKENGVDASLSVAIDAWFDAYDDGDKTMEVSENLVKALEAAELTGEQADRKADILNNKEHLSKKSMWMYGGDGWAYDIGFGGLDHVLASGTDVNILVVDTEVYSNTGGQASKATQIGAVAQFAASGKKTKKKDLGLMAMQYGYCYVAQVAMGANPAQLAKVLKEAEEFKGPSLIIAYAPCINHGLVKGMGCAQQEAKEAVAAGYWNLYHYNPDLKKEGKNPFVLDSKEPTLNLRDFLMGEVRFSALTRTFPEEAEKLLAEAELDAKEKYQEYKKLAEG